MPVKCATNKIDNNKIVDINSMKNVQEKISMRYAVIATIGASIRVNIVCLILHSVKFCIS